MKSKNPVPLRRPLPVKSSKSSSNRKPITAAFPFIMHGALSPCYEGSGKGRTSRDYCTQPYPAFLQEAVFMARIRNLSVTWQQLYQLRQGSPSI
ncbi:hypothetical protein H5410_057115 [Solanum commersonii]|uniref:Uncharacterized protein n=1 Tax=Solanum commersonii TaxID=4109 RepID=A0A9J5WNR6_SOLCO|nr:hypothetical protein H5410_057115 [Solanum commersonii]